MKTVLLFTFSFCALMLSAQQNHIEGYVNTTVDDLPGTVAINVSAQKYAVTDDEGWFKVEGSVGDTILISRLGYHDYKFAVQHQEGPIDLFLEERSHELHMVVVSAKSGFTYQTSRTCSCYPKRENKPGRLHISYQNELEVYPNPTFGRVHLKTNDVPIASIVIYNFQGQLIEETLLNRQNTIDLSAYPAGTYLINGYDLQGNLMATGRAVKLSL